jgi:hypothetical protein
VNVAADLIFLAAGCFGDFSLGLRELRREGNRIEDGRDKLIEPVRKVVPGVGFGNGVTIDDERLRKRGRDDRAAVFVRS